MPCPVRSKLSVLSSHLLSLSFEGPFLAVHSSFSPPDKRAMDCRRHGELSLFQGDPVTVCSTPYSFLLLFHLPS